MTTLKHMKQYNQSLKQPVIYNRILIKIGDSNKSNPNRKTALLIPGKFDNRWVVGSGKLQFVSEGEWGELTCNITLSWFYFIYGGGLINMKLKRPFGFCLYTQQPRKHYAKTESEVTGVVGFAQNGSNRPI